MYFDWTMSEDRKVLFVMLQLKGSRVLCFNGGKKLKSNGLDKASQKLAHRSTWREATKPFSVTDYAMKLYERFHSLTVSWSITLEPISITLEPILTQSEGVIKTIPCILSRNKSLYSLGLHLVGGWKSRGIENGGGWKSEGIKKN